MSIATTTTSYGGGDYRWLKSARGTEHPKSGTLDYSAFTAGTHFPNGYVPSGLAVAKITATGLYGPWAGPGTAEVKTFSRTSTGGTVVLVCEGVTATVTVAASAAGFTAAALLAGLYGLPQFGPDAIELTVTGDAGGPLVVTGPEGINLPPVTVDNTSATGGTVTVAETTAGAEGASDGTESTPLFVYHDAPLNGTADIPVALLNDVTIDASFCPVSTGLVDGRYIADQAEA
jgi:hypothetical protein